MPLAIDGAVHLHSGKVRDLYEVTEGAHAGKLLMVASDRLSIFDFVLETTIPDKGEILTRMSLWWFEQLADLVPNHIVSTEVPEAVRGRAVICERLDMYPVECVARGYLTGSGLLDYRASGEVCGIALPAGLEDGSRLPEPIFTPATKADLGDHDENVSFEALEALFPGRIDLGIGRAPGTDQLTAMALRRSLTGSVDDFPNNVAELQSYLAPADPTARADHRVSAQDRRIRVNDDVILDGRVALLSSQ